jgi:hypothetical protein
MRIYLFFISIILLAAAGHAAAQTSGQTTGQSPAYVNAMKKAVSILDTAAWNYNSYSTGAEKFAFISARAPGEWLPYYYHAYCVTSLSRMVNDPASIDSLTAIADKDLKEADSLNPNSSEIYCLKSLNVVNKINADYMHRGISYSKIANDIIDLSAKLDSTNPRTYYLKGTYLYFRPAQFGGGKAVAKPWLEKALVYYNRPQVAGNGLLPHWGKNENENLLKKATE